MANKTIDIDISSYTAQPRSERHRRASGVSVTASGGGNATLAADVEWLKSLWAVDDDGNLYSTYNTYTMGTFSALGRSEDDGSGSGEAPTVDLSGYATQAWVYEQGYITATTAGHIIDNRGFATTSWVEAKGYQTAAQVSAAIAAYTPPSRSLWGQLFNGTNNIDGTIVVHANDDSSASGVRSIVWNFGGFEVRNADQEAVVVQMSQGRCLIQGLNADRTARDTALDIRGDIILPVGKKIICGAAWLMYDSDSGCWRSNKGIISNEDITALDND